MLKVATRGVIVLGMIWAGAANAAPEGWRVSEKSGAVSILHSGVSRIALQGNGVATGDLVSTGANGRAVLVRGQEYVVVAPNSRLRIADPAQSGGVVQIIQDVGNVIFKIKRMATPHFAVQTPYLAAVVKGTTFSVTVGEAGASVQVIEGAVEVKTRDGLASELIRPGMIAAVTAIDRFSLRVDGDTSHVVRSPNAPASGADTTQYENSSAALPAEEVKIGSPITETAQSVGDLTGGLIEGTTALSASMSVASTKLAIETASQTAIATPASTAFEAPVVTATAPVIVAAAPVVTATAPVIVAAAPVVTATAPVIVAAAPVVTATAPVIVAAAPVVTATAPVIVAAAPVVTATAPVIVAAAPVVTATAPVIVAAAPVVVATAPVIVAAAPVVTATAPVIVAAAPVVTVTAPVIVAAAPVVVAAAPVVTSPPPGSLAAIIATVVAVVQPVLTNLGTTNLGNNNPGTTNLGNNNPGTTNLGNNNPGTTNLGNNNPGINNLGNNNPGTTNLGNNNPGINNLGNNNPGINNFGSNNHGGNNRGGNLLGGN